MSNSMKPLRAVPGIYQSLFIVLSLLTCGALSAQNQQHRVRNIVLVSRRLGRWFWLERRLRHPCEGRLHRQPRPRAGNVVPRRCRRHEARPCATRRPVHSCRSQLRRIRNYGSWHGSSCSRIGVRRRAHARRWRKRGGRLKALPERPRQVGRHKENAGQLHLYRPGPIS